MRKVMKGIFVTLMDESASKPLHDNGFPMYLRCKFDQKGGYKLESDSAL